MTQSAQKSVEAKEKADAPLSVRDSRYLINRQLSWLEFNRRVLEAAFDETTPLLERLKFLTIFSTNLDEFFMIRVAGLKEQIADGVVKASPDGMMLPEQLQEIRRRVLSMIEKQMSCLHDDVLPKLAENGIKIYSHKDLSKAARKKLDEYFLKNIFPILTPQAIDISHRFPYVSNLSLNVGLSVEPDKNVKHGNVDHLYNRRRFVRIKLPPNLPRLIPFNERETHFALLGELVGTNVGSLFPNMVTHKSHLFRLTRDADIELREDESDDLLRSMEREIHQRQRFTFPVRLEVSPTMPEEMVRFLTESISYLTDSISLTDADVYRINGFLNVPDLMALYSIDRPDLKDQPIKYSIPRQLQRQENVFDTLKKQDVLLHHPYTAFSTVTDFIEAAAEDEKVSAIKICLYRTGKNSPIVKSLIKANQNGKQVAALVELKARFDEENNIEWARRLEDEGIHVIYGMRGLKTHSKVTLVVRRENDEQRRYVHIGTGNYNPGTAKIYTDLGILTSDKEIGADASDLFNFLTGYSYQTDFSTLLVAPINLRERMLELIERETKHKKHGAEARIIVKINSLTDDKIVRALYRASQAGVKIDLLVRGICVLRPGIKSLSENIRVVSIVGRFLEHSRIFYFANAGDEEIFIGSADWMHRNLDRRVEAAVPIKDRNLLKYIREKILAAYLKDNVNARILNADGNYEKIKTDSKDEKFDSQMYFVGQEI
jgi:polyphosphate kinase